MSEKGQPRVPRSGAWGKLNTDSSQGRSINHEPWRTYPHAQVCMGQPASCVGPVQLQLPWTGPQSSAPAHVQPCSMVEVEGPDTPPSAVMQHITRALTVQCLPEAGTHAAAQSAGSPSLPAQRQRRLQQVLMVGSLPNDVGQTRTSRLPACSSVAALLSHQAAALAFGRSHRPAAHSLPFTGFRAAKLPAAIERHFCRLVHCLCTVAQQAHH